MGLSAVNLQIELVIETCLTCGIQFGLPSTLQWQRKQNHQSLFCPNGHSFYYPGESDAEKNARLLRDEQERHKRTIARANELEAEKKRIEKRIANGCCPCCRRTFKNVQRHIATKHPDFQK